MEADGSMRHALRQSEAADTTCATDSDIVPISSHSDVIAASMPQSRCSAKTAFATCGRLQKYNREGWPGIEAIAGES
jgi:hypothetical protein